tara:strand:- start:1011 stop:1268 length:258 start_codon:yes stop_codon:yes gene_type:complete
MKFKTADAARKEIEEGKSIKAEAQAKEIDKLIEDAIKTESTSFCYFKPLLPSVQKALESVGWKISTTSETYRNEGPTTTISMGGI